MRWSSTHSGCWLLGPFAETLMFITLIRKTSDVINYTIASEDWETDALDTAPDMR
jgi:hypothetical protein